MHPEYLSWYNDDTKVGIESRAQAELSLGIKYIVLPFDVDQLKVRRSREEWEYHTYNGNKIYVSWALNPYHQTKFVLNKVFPVGSSTVNEDTDVRILPPLTTCLTNGNKPYIKDYKHKPKAGFCNFYYYRMS